LNEIETLYTICLTKRQVSYSDFIEGGI